MPEGKKCVHPKRRVWVVSLRAAAAAARTCKKTADLPNPPLETDHEGAGNGQSHVGAPFLQTLCGPPCSVGRDGAGVWLTFWSAALNRFEPLLTDLPTSFYAAPSIGCIRTAADRWQPGRGCWRWLILCRHKWQICLSVESHWLSVRALSFISDAISEHWLLKSTSSRIRCLSSWNRIDCSLLFMCPALTLALSQVQNNKHFPLAVSCFFWFLIVQLAQLALILTITYYRNCKSLFSVCFSIRKRKKEQRFTLTRLPTEGWISRCSWQPS